MPSNLNKFDIDEQFTKKAWKDMQDRLDKALPIKKPFFLSKWLSLAAVFCLMCAGGYWFVLQNGTENLNQQKLTTEQTKTETKKEDVQQNKTSPSPVIPKLTKNSKQNTKEKTKINKQANIGTITQNTLNNQIQKTPKNQSDLESKSFENTSSKQEKLSVVQLVKNSANQLNNSLPSKDKNLKPLSTIAKKPTLNSIPKQVKTSVIDLKKTNNALAFKSESKNQSTFSKTTSITSKSSPNFRTSIYQSVNNLVTINRYLDSSPNLLKNALTNNQSSTGLLKNRELITQKNEDERLHPKTINYGIKQGLSSDLTSESKIFAGALIDFNFNQKCFIEFAPGYQFGAINQKNKIQYDTVTTLETAPEILDTTTSGTPDNPDQPGEPSAYVPAEEETEIPTSISTYSKDTVSTTITTNRHSVAADFLFGYRMSPKIEALIGISSARRFNHQSKNADNLTGGSRESTTFSNIKPLLYNNWSLAPKIALRFALKPKLSVETFYAYNLIPTIKKEYQIETTDIEMPNNYFTSNYGLAFVYKFK